MSKKRPQFESVISSDSDENDQTAGQIVGQTADQTTNNMIILDDDEGERNMDPDGWSSTKKTQSNLPISDSSGGNETNTKIETKITETNSGRPPTKQNKKPKKHSLSSSSDDDVVLIKKNQKKPNATKQEAKRRKQESTDSTDSTDSRFLEGTTKRQMQKTTLFNNGCRINQKQIQPETKKSQNLNTQQIQWSETDDAKRQRLKLYLDVLRPENFFQKIFTVKKNSQQLLNCSDLFQLPEIENPIWRLVNQKEIQRILYMSPEQCLAASDRLNRLSDDEYSKTMKRIVDGNFLMKEKHNNKPAEVPWVNLNHDFTFQNQEGAHRIIAAQMKKCELMPILVTFKLTEEQVRVLVKGVIAQVQSVAIQEYILLKFRSSGFKLGEGENFAAKAMCSLKIM